MRLFVSPPRLPSGHLRPSSMGYERVGRAAFPLARALLIGFVSVTADGSGPVRPWRRPNPQRLNSTPATTVLFCSKATKDRLKSFRSMGAPSVVRRQTMVPPVHYP